MMKTTIKRHDLGDATTLRERCDNDRKIASVLLARAAAPRDATALMEQFANTAAIDLALGASPSQMADDAAQAATFATAAALDARHPAANLLVGARIMPCGDPDMYAWRWWQAFALVGVAGAAKWRHWLGKADVIAACQSPAGLADAFWLPACHAFAAAMLGGDPGSACREAMALLDAAEIASSEIIDLIMRPRLAAIVACAGIDSAAWGGALASALQAHRVYWGEDPRYETPDGFVAWDLAALRAVANARGLHDDVESPYLEEPPRLPSHPPISLDFPETTAADALEAHWLMDRAGLLRAGRTHRTAWRSDVLVAQYEAPESADTPAALFTFVLDAEPRGTPPLRALDPGQAMEIADRLSSRVPDHPPADAAARRMARADLAEAMAALARIRVTGMPDEAFWSAEGVAVRDAEPGRFRAERLEAVLATWRALLAGYDAAASPAELPRTAFRAADSFTRAASMAEQARPVLQRLADDPGRFLASVRPRPGDAALAFVAEAAEAAGRAYDKVWHDLKPPHVDAGQTELRIVAAPAGELGSDTAFSAAFPTGYRDIARFLQPQRVWLRWQHLRPGAEAGLALDGLVWLDDHWTWFPRPHHALAALR